MMEFFNKKKTDDYFIEMVQSLTEIKTDSKNLKESFREHADAEYERRKIDREWQKCIDTKLAKAIKCPRDEDIDILMEDKIKSEGKFLGIKSVYAVALGVVVFIGGVLAILWRLGVV